MSEDTKHISFCPHCGNNSPQRTVFQHTYRDTWYGADDQPMARDDVPNSEAIVCICETCDGILLYDGISVEESGFWPKLVYPRNASLPDSVPASIQSIYYEAAMVKRNAPNAFAIMIRKGLEAICDDRGVSNGNLSHRLKELAAKGEIPLVLAEVTDALRVVGNSAAHGSLQKITAPMTWAIDDFFRAIIEYVYVAPEKLEKFKARLSSNGFTKK